MRRRKHRARARRLPRLPVLLALVLVLSSLFAGAAYAGYRYDRATAVRLLPGVRVAGVAVGGMTRAEAERAVRAVAEDVLDRQITVRVAGKVYRLTPRKLGSRAGVDAALDRAFALSDSMSWTSRLFHRLLDRPVTSSVDLEITHAPRAAAHFVQRVAREVEVAPRDADRDFAGGELVVVRSAPGRALRDGRAATDAVFAAVRGVRSEVRLGVKEIEPAVTEADLGYLIVVRVGQNRLHLYDGFDLVKTYEVATGTPDYPTPHGHWTIVNKRENPTWVNPAPDGWGKDLPESIGPGPGNPLGTRALDLDAPGIRIHGTYDDLSIGSYASHGCIRMHIPQSEELFGIVPVGTPVIVTT